MTRGDFSMASRTFAATFIPATERRLEIEPPVNGQPKLNGQVEKRRRKKRRREREEGTESDGEGRDHHVSKTEGRSVRGETRGGEGETELFP